MSSIWIGAKLALIALAAVTLASCDDQVKAACVHYERPQSLGTVRVQNAAALPRMSCAMGVELHGRFYGATQRSTTDIGAEVLGVVTPGCNDTGGTSEPDVPTPAY